MAEYNQHTQVRILQRALRLDVAPPVEVFSNNPKLRNLPEFETLLTSVWRRKPRSGACGYKRMLRTDVDRRPARPVSRTDPRN